MVAEPPLVLVVSAESDWTAQAVVEQLRHRGVAYRWWDPSRFPAHASACARIGNPDSPDGAAAGIVDDDQGGGWSGWVDTVDERACWERVSAVLYRRPGDFTVETRMSGPERRFARAQARIGLGGVLASLPARWVNHPSVLADADYKPRQLAVAQRAGLRIPATVITNDPDEVRAFAAACRGPVVTKPLTRPMLAEDNGQVIAWTRCVPRDELNDLDGVALTAHLFQQWVPKDHEVRLMAIGERLFAVAIHAWSEAAHIDWRSDYDALTYQEVSVPDDVADGVRRYLDVFGLRYAAFDMVVRPDGAWVFLEANASGQWGWLAEACNLPIAAAFADELTTTPTHTPTNTAAHTPARTSTPAPASASTRPTAAAVTR